MDVELEDEAAAEVDVVLTDLIISVDDFGPPFGRRYRIFGDEDDKMNLNVQQAGGSLLVVSQFTLVADTQKGMRPSFSRGAVPQEADRLYRYFVGQCQERGIETQTGEFAADMQVALVNDGPVTFWLQV